jgi:hypothetical protein
MIETLLRQHVLPEMTSPHRFLRLRVRRCLGGRVGGSAPRRNLIGCDAGVLDDRHARLHRLHRSARTSATVTLTLAPPTPSH